jgi:hypothetical protein
MLTMMDEVTQPSIEPPNFRARILVSLLAIAHVLVNLFYNPMGSAVTGSTDWLMKMLIGVVVAQPVLYAVWALIGPSRLLPRLLLTFLAFAAVLFAQFYRGLCVWDRTGQPIWENPATLAFPIGVFAICGTLMTLVRKLTGWRIVSTHSQAAADSAARQFNMKFLLGFTALCAALLAAGRIASEWLEESPAESVGDLLSAIGVLLMAAFPALLVPLLALSKRASRGVLVAIPFLWIGVTLLSAEAIVATQPGEVFSKVLLDLIHIQLGVATAGLFSALVLRWAGYRLVTLAPASTPN